MMKRICLILSIMIVVSFLYIFFSKNTSNITSLLKYKPFNSIDKSLNSSTTKISNKLPKVEVATAFYPLASSIIENIYEKNSYNDELFYTSTSTAYEDLLSEKTDAIIVTKPSENQQKMIDNSNMNIKFIPIAREALIFYTAKQSEMDSITVENIRNIYTNQNNDGKIKNDIKTYQLAKDNGSQTCFENIVKENHIDNINHFEVNDMGMIIDKVARSKNSIGYAFNSFYTKIYNNSNLKLLCINKIKPNAENIVSGRYPLMYDVYFAYNDNNSNTNITKMVEWILSEQGQKLIEYNELQRITKY